MVGVGGEAQGGDLTKGPATPAQSAETPEGRFAQNVRPIIERFNLGDKEGLLRIAQAVDKVDAQRIAEGKPSLFPTLADRIAARASDQDLRSSNDRRQREEGSGRIEDLVVNLPALPFEGIDESGHKTNPIADRIAAIASSYAPVIGQENAVSVLSPAIERIISYKSGEKRAPGEVDKPWTPDQVAQFRQELVKRRLLKEETPKNQQTNQTST